MLVSEGDVPTGMSKNETDVGADSWGYSFVDHVSDGSFTRQVPTHIGAGRIVSRWPGFTFQSSCSRVRLRAQSHRVIRLPSHKFLTRTLKKVSNQVQVLSYEQ